jgi:predicted DNA-binding protein YlxM (UPF0122 family)
MPHDYTATWKESMKDPQWQKALQRFVQKKYSLKEIAEQHQTWKSRQVSQVMSKSGK